MGAEILLVIVALAIALVPAFAGFDSRDGKDWQPPQWWIDARAVAED